MILTLKEWVCLFLLFWFPLSVAFPSGIDEHGTSGGGAGTVSTSAPVSGDGSAGTPVTIANGAITLPKLATQADQTVLGNGSGGVASPVALTLGGLLQAGTNTLSTSIATLNIAGRTTAGTGPLEALAVSGGLSLATAGTLTTSSATAKLIGRTTAGTGPYEQLAVSGGLDLGTAGTLQTSTATGRIIGRTTAATGPYEQLVPSGLLSLATAGTLTTSMSTANLVGRTTAGTGAMESLALGSGLSLGTAGSFTTSIATGRLWGRTTAATGQIEEITPNSTNFTLSGGALAVASGGISLSNMANLAATSIIGNATGSPATPAALTLVSPLVFSGTTVTTSIATAKIVGRTTAGSGVVEQLAVSGGLDLGTAGTLQTSTATAKIIGRTTAGTGPYEQLTPSGLLSLATAGTLTTSMSTANLVGRTTAGTGAMESLALGSGLSLATAGSFTTSIATARLWGRTTAGTGQIEEITVGTGLTLSGGSITASGATFAVKADQGTGASPGASTTLAINPAVQQFHPSAAKAWCNFTAAGSINPPGTNIAKYNIASITNNAAADDTVAVTTAFTDTYWLPIFCSYMSALNIGAAYQVSQTAQSTTQARCNQSGSTANCINFSFVGYGNQ